MAVFTGTSGNDSYTVQTGDNRYEGRGGTDTATFDFNLTDAKISFSGSEVIVETANSRTVLTGFQIYKFKDGTVDENDGNSLVSDLFYYSQYHDVWNAKVDADAHYGTLGFKEGRDPSAFFDTTFYLSLNQSVKAAGTNPLVHFEATGWKTGLPTSPAFDMQAYLKANPDVAAANINPLSHFLQLGLDEGRQPFPVSATGVSTAIAANGFDPVFYLMNNPDVAAAGLDPFSHFQNFGWKEGRNPNAFFDTDGYLNTYSDVKAAGLNPLDHYMNHGWKEGRNPSTQFDTAAYLAANPDVQAAGLNPLQHYLRFGRAEGRAAIAEEFDDANKNSNEVTVGAGTGTQVGLTASWGNWNGVVYAITSDSSNGGFAINSQTGVVTVADNSKVTNNFTHNVTVTAANDGYTVSKQFSIVVGTGIENTPPTVGLDNLLTSTSENGGQVKAADIVVTDDGQGTNNITLIGADAASFAVVNGTTGPELHFLGGANFEVKSTYEVTVNVDDPTVGSTPDAPIQFFLTITNINEPAAITGNTTGSVTEKGGVANGTAGTATATGDLNATDVDSATTFTVQTAAAKTYGTFSIDAAGTWSYTLDDGNATVQALAAGGTLHELVTVTTADGTAQVIDITINGANDAAVISGDTTGSVTEKGGIANGTAGVATATGDLNASDVDSATTFTVQNAVAKTYGTFSIDAAGNWSYTLNDSNATVQAFNAGGTLHDFVTVTTADGTSQVIDITINGANDTAVISGDTTGSVTEKGGVANGTAGIATATGDLNASDVDSATTFTVQTAAAKTYGTFSIDAAGTWSYTLNDNNATVQALAAGGTLHEFVTVTTADGTSQVIDITITGANDAAVISGNTTGSVTEKGGVANGTAGTATATGDLNASDVDSSTTFTAQNAAAKTYGMFSIDTAGTWTYTVNDNNAAVQALVAGGTLHELVTVTTADGTAQVIDITINGANDAAVISGDTTGSVTEKGGAANGTAGVATATGDLNASDVDSATTFTVQTAAAKTYGTFSIDAAGTWSYTLNDNNATVQALVAGGTLHELVTVTTADGTAQVIDITINGANDTPVAVDDAYTVNWSTGSVAVTDANAGLLSNDMDVDTPKGSLVVSLVNGPQHGTLGSLNSDGTFTYTVGDPAFDTDSFTYKVTDGSGVSNTATVTITIAPPNAAPALDLDTGTATTSYATTFTSGPAAAAVAGVVSITDDRDALISVTARLTIAGGGALNSGEKLALDATFAAGLGSDFSTDTTVTANEYVLTITSAVAKSAATFQQIIQNIRYSNPVTDFSFIVDDRAISFTIKDAAGLQNAAPLPVTTIDIAAKVTGSGTFIGANLADTITGQGSGDMIEGGAGGDTINGGAGDDTIEGQDGNDTLNGGAGDDTVNGGAGDDVIVQGLDGQDLIDGGTELTAGDILKIDANIAAGVTVELRASGTQGNVIDVAFGDVTFSGIEHFQFAGSDAGDSVTFFTDFASLNLETIRIETGAGGDTLDFSMLSAGDVFVDMGTGDDQIALGESNDTVHFGFDFGSDLVTNFKKGADKLVFEKAGYADFDIEIAPIDVNNNQYRVIATDDGVVVGDVAVQTLNGQLTLSDVLIQ